MLCRWRCVHVATPSLVLVGRLRGWQQLCCKPSVESGVSFTSSSRHGGCPQAEPEATPPPLPPHIEHTHNARTTLYVGPEPQSHAFNTRLPVTVLRQGWAKSSLFAPPTVVREALNTVQSLYAKWAGFFFFLREKQHLWNNERKGEGFTAPKQTNKKIQIYIIYTSIIH